MSVLDHIRVKKAAVFLLALVLYALLLAVERSLYLALAAGLVILPTAATVPKRMPLRQTQNIGPPISGIGGFFGGLYLHQIGLFVLGTIVSCGGVFLFAIPLYWSNLSRPLAVLSITVGFATGVYALVNPNLIIQAIGLVFIGAAAFIGWRYRRALLLHERV